MNHAILFGFIAFAFWLIKRDIAARPGLSRAIWIPTLWVAVISSRNVSAWLGVGGGSDTFEGSPADRLFFLSLIVASIIVLSRREVRWVEFCGRNWSVVLFYAYLLVTVMWANSPPTSLKRWIKEFGNVFVILVILTENDPLQAIRAIFVRCAYVLIPLSAIFIRYFPDLGRRYNIHNGAMEPTGVTFQKNSLGTLLLVCGLVFLWDWLVKRAALARDRLDRFVALALLATAVFLFHLSDSKTSMVAAGFASSILIAYRVPIVHRHSRTLGTITIAGALFFVIATQLFDFTPWLTAALGRDITFTGRTAVWQDLLSLHTDPILGVGFMSIWDDAHYQRMLTLWPGSAHNGYLEIYLAGGMLGLVLLTVMLISTASRIHHDLPSGDFAVVRLAMFFAAVITNLTESNFACMTPIGLIFLLAACSDSRWMRARGASIDTMSVSIHREQRAIGLGAVGATQAPL